MADKPEFSSILDEFLSDREPDYKALGLSSAKISGDEWLDRTHSEDDGLLDELAGASHHTQVPPTSKGAGLINRLIEKENAAPRMGSGRTAQARTAGGGSEDDSLVAEITESFEEAAKGGTVEKRHRSDGEIQRYVHQLLNQGVTPAKVAAKLKQLSDFESFNPKAANEFLQKHAGILGMAYMEPNKTAELELFDKSKNMGNAYLNNSDAGGTGAQVLEPNTFMDGNNPSYERTASAITHSPTCNSGLAKYPDGVPSGIKADRNCDCGAESRESQLQRGVPESASQKKAYGFNTQSELNALQEAGGIVSTIRPGDRITITVRGGRNLNGTYDWKEATGRAVMYNAQYQAWVLNMGGKHGTPAMADEANIIKVHKAKPKVTAAEGDTKIYGEEEQHTEITPVIFRKWKDNGDILAIFPYDLGTDDAFTCSSYEHVGQHSACDPQGCIQRTLPAKPEEYAALKAELESLGYKLKPMNRLQYNALLSRETQLKQYRANSVPEPVDDSTEETYLDDGTLDDNPEGHLASSQDCVRQAKAWKAAGITPRAKSVKQVTACADCSYFKKNGGTKSCGLYGLPVVGNAQELASIVNKLTAGVPAQSKRAALVQIANRLSEQIQPKPVSTEAPFVRQASFTKAREFGFVETQHFSGSQIQKLHTAGHSLKAICAAAEKKYGALEVSKAVREFVASLRFQPIPHGRGKGKIIMAQADADYLKKLGIHNEAIVGAAKCASCKSHNGKELHKAALTDMVTRAPEAFVQATPGGLRANHQTAASHFDSGSVAKLHTAGHSVEKIYKAASAKYGMVTASKAVRDWAQNLKNTDTKIALSQIDCTTLKKMGVKLSSKNAIVGAEKCGSCSYRSGMHCGLTGGTLLSFPGMNQVASTKKVGKGAPVDGRSILSEYDLMGSSKQDDIDMDTPDRAEIQMGPTMDAGEI